MFIGGSMDNKKEIRKTFDGLTKDILDHYNDYEIEDRIAVKEQIESFKKLNNLLKVYDIKMQKEEIKTTLNVLIEDILDNYEKYSESHKDLIKQEMLAFKTLNSKLDKYDNQEEVVKKKSLWDKLINLFKWS